MMGEWISLYNNIMNNKVGGIKKKLATEKQMERERAVKSVSTDERVRVVK